MPTLDEVLQRFPDHHMVIEIKQSQPSLVEPLCTLIRRHGMQERTLVSAFDSDTAAEFRETCPEIATGASEADVRAFVYASYGLVTSLLPIGFQAFQVPEEHSGHTLVTSRFVDAAHARNVQVHVWTIDDPADMARFTTMGVDGIVTNQPEVLLEMHGRADD